VQAGSAELLAQRDGELRRRRREALIAERQHGARAKAVDGMRAAVAAAASGRPPTQSRQLACVAGHTET
jgi:hypothetical protein